MAKYYKFTFSAGYIGTDESEIFKFPDSAQEREIEEVFDEWYSEQRHDRGNFKEISKEEAERIGICEDLED